MNYNESMLIINDFSSSIVSFTDLNYNEREIIIEILI